MERADWIEKNRSKPWYKEAKKENAKHSNDKNNNYSKANKNKHDNTITFCFSTRY